MYTCSLPAVEMVQVTPLLLILGMVLVAPGYSAKKVMAGLGSTGQGGKGCLRLPPCPHLGCAAAPTLSPLCSSVC